MNLYSIGALFVFCVGYCGIIFEYKIKIHKAAIALSLAGVLWIFAVSSGTHVIQIQDQLTHTASELFSLVVYLLSSMALVEILAHFKFFDYLKTQILKLHLNDKYQFILILFVTFIFSSFLDNLAITIIMLQIAKKFFKGNNLLIAAVGIVISTNAGGSWSPVGDITTLMMWVSNKYTAWEIVSHVFFPSLVLQIIVAILLVNKIHANVHDEVTNEKYTISRTEWIIIFISGLSFILPLWSTYIGIPGYLLRLSGLGFVWVIADLLNRRSRIESKLETRIERLLQQSDIASLKFFIGIILSISALESLGILTYFSSIIFTNNPSILRLYTGITGFGILSSIIDNVPITALLLRMLTVSDSHVWTYAALTLGIGGSFLSVGSIAGVIVSNSIKELTFVKYIKIAILPMTVGYIAALSTFLLNVK